MPSKPASMIRKSSFVLTFPNIGKQDELRRVLSEANRVTNVFIQALWVSGATPQLKFLPQKTATFLSAKAQQVCSAKALQIIKSAHVKKARRCPVFKALSLDLDSRFIQFLPQQNSFDLWIKLFGFLPTEDQKTIRIPCKKHRHFNLFVGDGWHLKNSAKLRGKEGRLVLDVYFEKPTPMPRSEGKVIGIDIGYKKLLATSEGQTLGTNFPELAAKIQKKEPGSKAFKKALTERDEYINRTIKLLPWEDLHAIVVENLKGLKDGRRFRKQFQAKFQRWAYPAILKRLELRAEVDGVHCWRVEPAFTSQTCSRCGKRDKQSRNGEKFACTGCGYLADADVNAAVNLSLKLRLPEHMEPAQKVCAD